MGNILAAGTINFRACQNTATNRGWEQNEDGVNIARQHMQSSASVCALCYDTKSSLLPAMSTAVSAKISTAASAAIPSGFAVH